jgi:hypothetical protein
MRVPKQLLLLAVLLSVVAIELAAVAPAAAFPGDRRDERCAERIAEITANTPEGETPELPADCLPDTGMTALELRAAEAIMRAEPYPDVIQVPYNEEVVWTRAYRRMLGDVTMYDAPHGNPIGQMAAGYNFVTIINQEDGFTQINWGVWVPSEQITLADVSHFSGVELQSHPKRPFAWMLAEAYPSRYPGGPQDKSQEMIERYTLMNIYGVEYVDGWEWYLVGPNQWVQQIRVAKVHPIARPAEIGPNDRWFAIDLYEQTLVAYEGDRMVFATLISSGLPQWSTNEGLFRVYERYEAARMSGAVGQPDFYYIEESRLRQPVDHGCVVDLRLHQGRATPERVGLRLQQRPVPPGPARLGAAVISSITS